MENYCGHTCIALAVTHLKEEYRSLACIPERALRVHFHMHYFVDTTIELYFVDLLISEEVSQNVCARRTICNAHHGTTTRS